jgi:hypothetical protein
MPDSPSREPLRDFRVAISASASPDLDRLGLTEAEFRETLAEVARGALAAGCALAYGGDLRADGYTELLIRETLKHRRGDGALLICLAWQGHREVALSQIEARRRELGPVGEIVCLDPDGVEVDPATGRAEAQQMVSDPALRRRGLTAMRRYLAERTRGRVLMGGKRSGFQGEIPGLTEEALYSLERSQPLYIAGGFGGATADIALALGVAGNQAPPVETSPIPPWEAGRGRILAFAASGRKLAANGLTGDENRRLAAARRPDEIAALVSLGLGRV